MNKTFWLSLGIASSLLTAIPSYALSPVEKTPVNNTKQSVRTIPQSKATGTSAELQTVQIWAGHGVSISFYETDETIKRVWLDDPSRILIDVDGCLEGLSNSNCRNSGAGLIHLRQINPVKIPGIPVATNGAHLTVVTQNKNGERKIYNFRVVMGKGSPQYSSIQITPDVTQKEAAPPDSIIVATISRGIQVAAEKRWITPSNPLWQKLQNLVQELESGKNLTGAVQSSGVSSKLAERLLQLGTEPTPTQQKIKPALHRSTQQVLRYHNN